MAVAEVVADGLRRTYVTLPQLAEIVRVVAPEIPERTVRGWHEKGVLRAASSRVGGLTFRAVEVLRAFIVAHCQDVFKDARSPLALEIAREVDEMTLALLATDSSPDPSVSVELGRHRYQIVVGRPELDDVLRHIELVAR